MSCLTVNIKLDKHLQNINIAQLHESISVSFVNASTPMKASFALLCDVWVGGDVLLANAKILLDNDKIIVI